MYLHAPYEEFIAEFRSHWGDLIKDMGEPALRELYFRMLAIPEVDVWLRNYMISKCPTYEVCKNCNGHGYVGLPALASNGEPIKRRVHDESE